MAELHGGRLRVRYLKAIIGNGAGRRRTTEAGSTPLRALGTRVNHEEPESIQGDAIAPVSDRSARARGAVLRLRRPADIAAHDVLAVHAAMVEGAVVPPSMTVVQDVPLALDRCESCRVTDCRQVGWQQCEMRLVYVAARLAALGAEASPGRHRPNAFA